MDKSYKFLVAAVLIVVAGLGGLYYYLNFAGGGRRSSGPQVTEIPVTGGEGQASAPQNQKTTIEIGSEGVSRGEFEKVEEGEIYFSDGTVTSKMPLTIDEVVLACTDQDFTNASELDFELITNINVYNNQTIEGKINPGDTVVVFATDVEGTLRAHTVALHNSATSCSE